MATAWPSQATSTTRASKGKPVTSTVPTDWMSGWIITLLILGMVAGVALSLMPLAVSALESIQSLSTTLGGKP